ncbi:MAG: hypothetical protein CSA45_01765, partial [Gammaproteobacteria bacterium]
MNCITSAPSSIINSNSYYSPRFKKTLLATAITLTLSVLSPTVVLAAGMITGTPGTPLIIKTDQSGNEAVGVLETGSNPAENGIVEIQTGGVIDGATGGHSDNGNATNNHVTVSGGTINGSNYGGISEHRNATNNSVTISGGTVTGNNTGGASG